MASDSAQQQQQQLPPPELQTAPEDVNLQKAYNREDLTFLTSGAREKLDKTKAGMHGAAQIMRNPFNKQGREDATAKTIEEKNKVMAEQESIRATAHNQVLQQKAIVAGGIGPQQPNNGMPGEENLNSQMPEPTSTPEPSPMESQQEENGVVPENLDSGMPERENLSVPSTEAQQEENGAAVENLDSKLPRKENLSEPSPVGTEEEQNREDIPARETELISSAPGAQEEENVQGIPERENPS